MHKTRSTAVLLICLMMTAPTFAQDEQSMEAKSMSGVPLEEHSSADLCAPDGIAVGGNDLVSYRSEDGPILGSPEFSAEHDGVTYLFASQENVAAFLEDPQHYLPAYTGFCAITLALGRVTCPEYNNFKIENDQLLLFEITGFTNGRTLWNTDTAKFRRQADDNFARLIRQE